MSYQPDVPARLTWLILWQHAGGAKQNCRVLISTMVLLSFTIGYSTA